MIVTDTFRAESDNLWLGFNRGDISYHIISYHNIFSRMVLCIIVSEVTQQNIRSCLLFQNNSFDISWSIFRRKLGVIFALLRSWQLDRETVFGEGIVIALKWIPHLGDKKTRDRKGGSSIWGFYLLFYQEKSESSWWTFLQIWRWVKSLQISKSSSDFKWSLELNSISGEYKLFNTSFLFFTALWQTDILWYITT